MTAPHTTFRRLKVGDRFRFVNPTPHVDGVCMKTKPRGYRAADDIPYICINTAAPVAPVDTPSLPWDGIHYAAKPQTDTACGFDLLVDYGSLDWTGDTDKVTCPDCRDALTAPCGPDPETREG